jgi:hypothetical protein
MKVNIKFLVFLLLLSFNVIFNKFLEKDKINEKIFCSYNEINNSYNLIPIDFNNILNESYSYNNIYNEINISEFCINNKINNQFFLNLEKSKYFYTKCNKFIYNQYNCYLKYMKIYNKKIYINDNLIINPEIFNDIFPENFIKIFLKTFSNNNCKLKEKNNFKYFLCKNIDDINKINFYFFDKYNIEYINLFSLYKNGLYISNFIFKNNNEDKIILGYNFLKNNYFERKILFNFAENTSNTFWYFFFITIGIIIVIVIVFIIIKLVCFRNLYYMDYNENKNNQNKKLIKKDNKNLEEKISDNNSKDSDKTIKSIPKSLSTYRGRSNYKGH